MRWSGKVIGAAPRRRHDDRLSCPRGLTARLDPRIGMALGVWPADRRRGVDALLRPQRLDGRADAEQRGCRAFAVGTVWVPLTMVGVRHAAAARPAPRRPRCFHLLRNIGSSFFISLSIAEIVAQHRWRTTAA